MTSKPDFPDWISPMLVKELRQGMRSRVFLFSFLALQAAMLFLVLISLLTTSNGNDTGGATVFFWLIICVPLLMVMPLSGLNAISREKKDNTLELIFLSRLGSRRIVAGKWLAIAAQTALLVSAVLPYAVLRYYEGGVDLVWDLEALGLLLLGSMLLTGVAVALSPGIGRAGMILVPIVLVVGLQFLGIVLGNSMFFAPGWTSSGMGSLSIFILPLFFLFYMLEVGAGKIAPAAENHSTPKRVAAVAIVAVASCYAATYHNSSPWFPASFILVPVLIGAVCEPVKEIASVYRPFVRCGWPGRIFGLLFYPGWPSGVLYSLAMLAALFLVPHGPFAGMLAPATGVYTRVAHRTLRAVMHAHWSNDLSLFVVICVAGSLFLPAALLHVTRARFVPPVVFYLLFQALCALLVILAKSLATDPYGEDTGIVAAIPFCGLLIAGSMQHWAAPVVLAAMTGATVVTLLSLLILFALMIRWWKKIFALEKVAAAAEAPRPEPNAIPSSAAA